MKKNQFIGLGTALITPFKNDKIDFTVYEKLIENQIDARVSYIVVAGSTGEGGTLSDEEFEALTRCAVKCALGRVLVVAGCNTSATWKAVETAQKVEKLGADGFMCSTPPYNRPTQEGLKAHYKAVSEATALPIILYTVPKRTGIDLTDDTLRYLAELENIVALKDASSDISKPLRLGGVLDLISGNDDTILSYMLNGGKGVISVASNIIPKTYVELISKCLKGEFVEALKMQQNINKLVTALSIEPNPIPVKYAAYLQGLCQGDMRLPLTEPSEISKNTIKEALKEVEKLYEIHNKR